MRVLVPYMLAYGGGIRRVLASGLPRLAKEPAVEVEYAELCANLDDMADVAVGGVAVNQDIGVPGGGVISHKSGLGRRWDQVIALPRLIRIVRRLRMWLQSGDIVYVHSYRDMLLTFCALYSQSRRARPSVVWHCHGLGDRKPPRLLRHMANRCDRIITVSQSAFRQLKEAGIRGDRVSVIHNAVDTKEIVERSHQELCGALPNTYQKKVLLLPCAAPRQSKGTELAIDALSHLPAHVELWISGRVDDPTGREHCLELQKVIEERGLQGRVHFIGQRADIYAVMLRADIVLVPSLVRESFGLVAAEAMALGKPVVVSNRGALPEVVASEMSGLIFDPESVGDLGRQICRLLEETELADRLARNGHVRVQEMFSYVRWSREVAQCLHHSRVEAEGATKCV